MDPVSIGLAATVVEILMPFVKKGAEEFISSAGKDAYEKSKNVLGILRKRWSMDKEAAETLEHFEEKPDRYKSAVEDILTEKLAQDRGLAEELRKMLTDMGPDIEIIQKMKVGENVTGLGADEMVKGKASIQEIDQAKDATGAKFKRIG